ncbi:hypothetical protein [Flavobacterium sp.]|nr:hypothetical protein [Flavobacterium sp.]
MRNGLIEYRSYIKMIEEAAYFMWLNGSEDPEYNWYLAEQQIIKLLKGK